MANVAIPLAVSVCVNISQITLHFALMEHRESIVLWKLKFHNELRIDLSILLSLRGTSRPEMTRTLELFDYFYRLIYYVPLKLYRSIESHVEREKQRKLGIFDTMVLIIYGINVL